jgi:hypothetical protein
VPRIARGLLDRRRAAEHDEIGDADLPAAAGGVEIGLDALKHFQHAGKLIGLVHFPIALRLEPDPRAIGAAALVRAAESGCRGPGGLHELGDGEAGAEQPLLQRGDLGLPDRRVIGRRDRILPQEILFRHFRPEVTDLRAHVAVAQLEPGARECIGIFGGLSRKRREIAA